MSELENLVRTGTLRTEPGAQGEFEALVRSGLERPRRFDLAYNAAHSLASAALRWHGFRPKNRYVVFQTLPHTLGVGPDVWRALPECHRRRNRAEYEGELEREEKLLASLVQAGEEVAKAVRKLGPVPGAD